MSTDTKGKKRKSGDDVVPPAKKAKTAKSAEKPALLKSALKKSKVETAVAEKAQEKKSKASKTAEPVEEEDEFNGISDNDSDDGAELTADQTAALLAGFSSSEDEDSDAEDDGIEVAKIPAAPTSKEVQKQLKKAKSDDPESTPGVIYVGRIPHGFHEPQMTAYFSQFGEITRLRLARNKKTGKSKHYAFVEFASAAVADIVARTMDKYLLFGHILQVRIVPQEQVKDGMFKVPKGLKKSGGRVRPRGKIEGTKMRKGMEREAWERRAKKELERRDAKKEKMAEMGYEYEMPRLRSVTDVPVKEKKAIEADAEGGAEAGVKLVEGKKTEVAPGVEEEVERVLETAKGGEKVTAKEVRTKRKSGGAASTVTKKKTKVTA